MSRADRDPDLRRMLFWWSELSDFELLMRASREKRTHKKKFSRREKVILVYVNELVQDQQNKYSDRALVNGELRKELEKISGFTSGRRLSHKNHFNLSSARNF